MPGDHRHRDCGDEGPRHVDQARQHDHRPAELPQHKPEQEMRHVEDEHVVPRLLEHDQPDPPRDEIPRHLPPRPPGAPQRRADPGEKAERRCAEVRDPARVEECGGRRRQVRRIDPPIAEEVAAVVEHHEDHHKAAEQVDRLDAGRDRGGRVDRLAGRGRGDGHGLFPRGDADVRLGGCASPRSAAPAAEYSSAAPRPSPDSCRGGALRPLRRRSGGASRWAAEAARLDQR